MRLPITLFFLLSSTVAHSGPVLQMNKAFNALIELTPYLQNSEAFKEKKNEKVIEHNLNELSNAFRLTRHDTLIKHDLFAPSYALISENINESVTAFKKDKKDFSQWVLKETMTLCMDCHGRLPQSVASSFQTGELRVDTSKIRDPYDLGVAYMIVRRYVDAREQFTRSIQDKIIRKESFGLILPFQQIMAIELKIKKDPAGMSALIDDFLKKKNLPREVSVELESWKKRLVLWQTEKSIKGIKNENDLKLFIKHRLQPLKKGDSFDDAYKVDLLLASGLLSNYFFENQDSPSAPELSLWLGWIEKRLKKEEFMSSGDLFLKQCIRKYHSYPVAQECLNEYIESIEFDFTGSGGTAIPPEIQTELNELKGLVKPPKK